MKGTILSVNISEKKGEKKHPVGQCRLLRNLGVETDGHVGTPNRQVSLLAKKSIDKIREKGLAVGDGDFAENLTTDGVDLHLLPLGTRLKFGGGVELRVTQIGKICHDRCQIFLQVGDCVMPREGIFAEVLKEGVLQAGDEFEVILS
jgi:molybdopterin adenylyltransferase